MRNNLQIKVQINIATPNSGGGQNQFFSTIETCPGTGTGTGTWSPFHRDLEHYRNLKFIRKCIKISYYSVKSLEKKYVTCDYKTIYRDFNQKRLRNTGVDECG